MNTQELRERIYNIEKVGYGTWQITVWSKRMKKQRFDHGWDYVYIYKKHITHNSRAIDRFKDHGYIPDRTISHGYTYKQAIKALINQ